MMHDGTDITALSPENTFDLITNRVPRLMMRFSCGWHKSLWFLLSIAIMPCTGLLYCNLYSEMSECKITKQFTSAATRCKKIKLFYGNNNSIIVFRKYSSTKDYQYVLIVLIVFGGTTTQFWLPTSVPYSYKYFPVFHYLNELPFFSSSKQALLPESGLFSAIWVF